MIRIQVKIDEQGVSYAIKGLKMLH